MSRQDFIALFFVLFMGCLLPFDLLVHSGRPATYDGPTHITTIAQFYSSLRAGEFPVRWSGNYANYGAPLPLYAHQLTAYLGSLFMFMGVSPEIAFDLVALVGSITSVFLMYILLRLFTRPIPALTGTTLFAVTAYRIVNLYIRGALPEFFVTTFILLSCISLVKLYRHSTHPIIWWFSLTLSITFIILTHPLIAMMCFLPLILVLLLLSLKHRDWGFLTLTLTAFCLGLMLTSYYLIPFIIESKYLIIGHEPSTLPINTTWHNFLDPAWNYFSSTSHPGPREDLPKLGIIELLIIASSFVVVVLTRQRSDAWVKRLRLIVLATLFFLLLSLPWSNWPYLFFPILSKIQYTWRWFAILQFGPPIILAFLVEPLKRPFIPLLLIVLILFLRLPQLYGKNYYQVPLGSYFRTIATLHTQNLNPIWMGSWRDYPPKQDQIAIIDGLGTVVSQEVTNLRHRYILDAQTPLRLVDYTFYFPGWLVLVDGQPITPEFQDPNYRGLLTFNIGPGSHQLELIYTNTKVRAYAQTLTLLSLGFCVLIVLASFFKPLTRFINQYQLTSHKRR